jgi:hypothetical protein
MPASGARAREALRLTGSRSPRARSACRSCTSTTSGPRKAPRPWLERITARRTRPSSSWSARRSARPWLQGERMDAGDVMVACAWRFGQFYNAKVVPALKYPALVAYSERAEALPEFLSTRSTEPQAGGSRARARCAPRRNRARRSRRAERRLVRAIELVQLRRLHAPFRRAWRAPGRDGGSGAGRGARGCGACGRAPGPGAGAW